jgi:hypothetical protein
VNDQATLDTFGRDYTRLAFGIEQHMPGFIDAWLGPESERADLEPKQVTPQELVRQAEALQAGLATWDVPDTRRDYVARQVTAMLANARRIAGETLPYRDEVRQLFDIEPVARPEAAFDAAIADLDFLLPGDGPVQERMATWREQYVVSPDMARQLVDRILPVLRERTLPIVSLPDDEAIEIRMVQNEPWSGYNWYRGNARSRVDLNTDLPIYAYRLTELLAHECYPGHHTEHALKERLYTEDGLGEQALQLINTPECLISEGIATSAEGMVFTPEELAQFRRNEVYAPAGIAGDPERELAIEHSRRALGAVPCNAALLLHEAGACDEEVVAYLQRYALSTEAEARKRFSFIANPLWRAYIFTYDVGHALVSAWLNMDNGVSRNDKFRRLLTEQVTPSQLSADLAAAVGELPAPYA